MADSIGAMQVARNHVFQDRVSFFAMKAAVAVMAEVATTPNHALRVTWSIAQLGGENGVLNQSIAVVTNTTIQASADVGEADQGIIDTDLEFTVNSLIDAWAGASS